MSFPKYHTFRNRKYRIHWRRPVVRKSEAKVFKKQKLDLHGRCWPPGPGAKMYIWPHANSWELLDTIIHEGFHAGCWDLSEETVTETVEDVIRLLKRMKVKIIFPKK